MKTIKFTAFITFFLLVVISFLYYRTIFFDRYIKSPIK